ncbi:hypothetical protein HD554DRAFT_2146277 [Boletus coccyginus]|nr:hypothetical protein HD554DRAFT_2146277 [Boletus coccyginus]
MASLQSIIEARQFSNYAAVMVISAVGYDYVITFSSESISGVSTGPGSLRCSFSFVILGFVGLL